MAGIRRLMVIALLSGLAIAFESVSQDRPRAPGGLAVDGARREEATQEQEPPDPRASQAESERSTVRVDPIATAIGRELGFGDRVVRMERITLYQGELFHQVFTGLPQSETLFLDRKYRPVAQRRLLGGAFLYYEAAEGGEPLVFAKLDRNPRMVGSGSDSTGRFEIRPDPTPGAPFAAHVALWLRETADVNLALQDVPRNPVKLRDASTARPCPNQPAEGGKTLKLHVEISAAARREADRHHTDPISTLLNQLAVIDRAFWCAGANIRVDAENPAESSFVESQLNGDAGWRQMLNRLEA